MIVAVSLFLPLLNGHVNVEPRMNLSVIIVHLALATSTLPILFLGIAKVAEVLIKKVKQYVRDATNLDTLLSPLEISLSQTQLDLYPYRQALNFLEFLVLH